MLKTGRRAALSRTRSAAKCRTTCLAICTYCFTKSERGSSRGRYLAVRSQCPDGRGPRFDASRRTGARRRPAFDPARRRPVVSGGVCVGLRPRGLQRKIAKAMYSSLRYISSFYGCRSWVSYLSRKAISRAQDLEQTDLCGAR